jgi:hypothetical protein
VRVLAQVEVVVVPAGDLPALPEDLQEYWWVGVRWLRAHAARCLRQAATFVDVMEHTIRGEGGRRELPTPTPPAA